MQLPKLEFNEAEHSTWARERADLYKHLGEPAGQTSLFDELRQEHRALTHQAFLLAASGVKVLDISDDEKLLLSHTRPTSWQGVCVRLGYQQTLDIGEGSTDTNSKTIAVFGEKIGLKADVKSAGTGGFGVWAGQEGFLGVASVHHSRRGAQYYVPYSPDEFTALEKLLNQFG